jgi:hypothetical protein
VRSLRDLARDGEDGGPSLRVPGKTTGQRRIAFAADHCRNALQMVLGLRQLADDLAGLPAHRWPLTLARELDTLAEGLERRLSRAVEQIEGRRLTLRPGSGAQERLIGRLESGSHGGDSLQGTSDD